MHSCPLFQVVFTFSAAVASALTCSAAQMGNISSRVGVGTGDNVLITGFTVSTGLSAIVVRALGPSLSAYGIAAPLMDPVLEVHDSTGAVIATNDNWRDTQQQEFGPGGIYAPFRPGNESEPAIAITLQPGSYTAVVRGKNGTTGIALAEVYIATGNSIENVSSRALVGTGDDALIGGLITTGDTGEFVFRALGPSLAQFGITNPLPNPRVELYDSNGQLIQYNDDWMDDQQQADQVDAKGLAPPNWLDSALVVTLAPGNYTAIVKAGDGNTSGVALLEVYGPLTSAKTTLASTRPVVNLRTEGAAGNGTTDDQAVITKAIAKAKSLGVPLYAPGGHTYAHSSYITLDGVSMYGDGDNTVFSASNAHAGALRLTGKNPSLKSLKVIYRSTPTTRLSRGTQTGVFMDHAAGFTVDNVTVANSPSAGILVFVSHGTATNYATVSNCRVKNTLADAYHCTGASSYVRLSGNSTTNPGDDMFAVVSYLGDGAQTHHITYSNNVGVWNRGTPNDSGRGMSVVGGNHITFNNNSVTNTEWAGVYLA